MAKTDTNVWHVLVVEDSEDDLFFLSRAMKKMETGNVDIRMKPATSLKAANALLKEHKFDLILLDLHLPESSGLDTLTHVKESVPKTPVVVMTALNDVHVATQAIKAGAQDFLIKDEIKPHTLFRAIRYAIERHRLMKKIEDSLEERFQKVIDKNVDGIIVINEQGMIEYTNPAAELILEKQSGALVGAYFEWPLNDTGESEITIQGKDGKSIKTLAMRHTASEWNHRAAFIICCKDITQEKKLRQLEEELIANSKYVKMLSHEIRTPLAIITGALENLIDQDTITQSEDSANFLKIALRNSRRLASIIHNVLELSRLESGKARISLNKIDVNAIIHEIKQSFAYYAEKPQIKIMDDELSELPPVQADTELIGQIINNLICNAIRYAKTKVMISSVAHHLKNKSKQAITVCVADDGPGIPPEELPNLFNRFIQLKRARTASKDYKGTGLGLAICEEIVKLHNGEIWAESQYGFGSRFFFTLPKWNQD